VSLHLLRHDNASGLGMASPAVRRLPRDWFAAMRPLPGRALLAATTAFGFLVFILGVGNRFTRGPLFIYVPDVDLIPPLNTAAWERAFVIHQQSPLFALCGGYQVGGMESLTVYQFLYMWEWLRAGSVFLLAVCCMLLGVIAVRKLSGAGSGAELLSVVGLAALGAAYLALYLALRYFADRAGLFATINIGQHRHALDVAFASVVLALLLAALAAPRQFRAQPAIPIAFVAFMALDIGFGALFEATDAAVVWTTFPGYADGPLPAFDRLFAFTPVWRNFTENLYLIQACHRLLSIALWCAALASLVAAMLHRRGVGQPAVLFGLLTLEGALGVAALFQGEPPVLSIAHQVGAILVLAAALAPAIGHAPPHASGFGPAPTR
jgi:cytochrome c oxidase assembly protein subunit 15